LHSTNKKKRQETDQMLRERQK